MCNGYLVVCGWQIIKGDISSNHLNAYITVNRVDDKDYLSVYFNESNPTSDTDFEISETMLLNEDVTQALGFDQIYMVKGIYEIDTNSYLVKNFPSLNNGKQFIDRKPKYILYDSLTIKQNFNSDYTFSVSNCITVLSGYVNIDFSFI